jgi:hypothetical protein
MIKYSYFCSYEYEHKLAVGINKYYYSTVKDSTVLELDSKISSHNYNELISYLKNIHNSERVSMFNLNFLHKINI